MPIRALKPDGSLKKKRSFHHNIPAAGEDSSARIHDPRTSSSPYLFAQFPHHFACIKRLTFVSFT
jgi:hypothetical protein